MRADESTIPTLMLDGHPCMLNAYFSDCFNRLLPPLSDTDMPPEAVMSEVDPTITEELLYMSTGALQTVNISKSMQWSI